MSSPAGRAFQTGLTSRVEELSASPYRLDPSLADHGIVSVLNVPIPVDNAAWGVLEIDSTVLQAFSEDTEEFLLAAAALVGLMVQRTRLEHAHDRALADQVAQTARQDVLLSEMQHRVKNNFQMILAMIDLHRRAAAGEECRAITAKIADKVMAMALAHNQLSPTRPDERIALARYLRALTASIEKPIQGVTLEVDANEMEVGLDQATPLGLIVNEAVTNAVKHAFGETRSGKITVELLNHGHGEALLSIRDDGGGFEPGSQTGGSGQKLMDALVRQLRGRIERESAPGQGAVVRVIFPRLLGPAASPSA